MVCGSSTFPAWESCQNDAVARAVAAVAVAAAPATAAAAAGMNFMGIQNVDDCYYFDTEPDASTYG